MRLHTRDGQPESTSAGGDTIVAVSTPPGRGGIGVVRLSGPGAVRVAGQLLGRGGGQQQERQLEHGRARVAQVLAEGGGVLDQVVVTAFLAPRSYTGEDVVEIAAHGAPVVLAAIVAMAQKAGARLAGPGEFTQRAFLAGRLDLAQAEAVGDLIAAQTLDQARVAAQQMGGALARQLAPAKEQLLRLIAELEAGMDFASGELDDVDVVPPEQIAAALAAVQEPLAALEAGFGRGQLLRNGAALALVGRPNAGKSSLFNRLLERERAIVTAIPGTTRDTLEEQIAIGGVPVRLIDTAGLRLGGEAGGEASGHAIDEVEALGMARSREALADADLVVWVRDASLPPVHDAEVLHAVAGRPCLVVWNKIDLVGGAPGAGAPDSAQQDGARQGLQTSALTGAGMDELREAVLAALGAGGGLGEMALLNNQRQHEALVQTLAALAAAAAANAGGMPHEVVLLDLHAALRAFDSVTGVTTTDDILARIFSAFCIGK